MRSVRTVLASFALTVAAFVPLAAISSPAFGNNDTVRTCLKVAKYVRFVGPLPLMMNDKSKYKENLDYALDKYGDEFSVFEIISGPLASTQIENVREIVKNAFSCWAGNSECSDTDVIEKSVRLADKIEAACYLDYRTK